MAEAQQEDFTKLSIEDKLAHKVSLLSHLLPLVVMIVNT